MSIRLPPWFFYFFLFQLGGAVIAIAFSWIWRGQIAGLSAVIGAIIGIVPGLFSAGLLFNKIGAFSAKKVVSTFYLGEVLKFIICSGLFTIASQWSKLGPIPLFGGFIATQLAYFMVLLVERRLTSKKTLKEQQNYI